MNIPVDRYTSYRQLAQEEKIGQDYEIRCIARCSAVAIFAPHGGGIEPGVSEIAAALAGNDLSLYTFEALKVNDSRRMHISSALYDEPICLALLQQTRLVITVHGCQDAEPLVYIGGRRQELMSASLRALQAAGFPALADETHHCGQDPANICNRGAAGTGMQLEISHGMRQQFFAGLTRPERQQPTPLLAEFAACLRKVLRG